MYSERLNISPTKRSPWVVLAPGRIFIMGRSVIETPSLFYEPVLGWIAGISDAWSENMKIELGFEYVNTASVKWLYLLIRHLQERKEICENNSITWYYEKGDEDMKELGSIFRSLVECPFHQVEVESMDDRLYKTLLKGPGF